MTIKTQKIIRFVPFVNVIVTVFQFYRFYYQHNVPKRNFFKTLAYIAILCIVVAIFDLGMDYIISYHTIEIIIDYIATYLYMFIISTVVIKDQEKLMRIYE